MKRPGLVVIGGSAGSVEALEALVARLPPDFGAALLVVIHIGARRSAMPRVLAAAGPLPAAWPVDGEEIRPGRIYVAPPDHHLLVTSGCDGLRLSRGPAENRTRPAIDPLFRSAARACGPAVIGVVLSGTLGDGTAGLAEVARQGGVTVVQDPGEALFPDMPRSALRYVQVEHRLPVAGITELLIRLCGTTAGMAREADPAGSTITPHAKEPPMSGEHELKQPSALTCPSCGGAVEQRLVDSLPYFECHVGHRFAAQDMDEAQFQQLGQALEVALRVLNERTELTRRLARVALDRGQTLSAGRWNAAAREAEERAEVLRRFLEQSWERPSDDGDEAGFPTQATAKRTGA